MPFFLTPEPEYRTFQKHSSLVFPSFLTNQALQIY